MQHSRSGDNLGAKLMPKMIDAIVQSVISTKQGLTSHEVNVRKVATQDIIDRMGHEAADHFRPLMDQVLAQETIHPDMREFLANAASGDDQWQAAGQFLFQTSGIAGAFGDAISNAVAPIAYAINRVGPNLVLDPSTSASAAVRGIITEGLAFRFGEDQGTQTGLMQAMMELAQTIPDMTTLFQLWNRNVIDEATVKGYLHRSGFPVNFINELVQLKAATLSPADAALGVLRGTMSLQDGRRIAGHNGISEGDFDVLIENTGEPPGAQELAEGLRRGFINRDVFAKGIRQSRVRNEWIGLLENLRYSPMSTSDAVQAFVQSYIGEAELKRIADQNGLEPGAIDTVALAAGEPLSRTEMTELVRRGEATVGEFDQAMRESRLKNKYIAQAGKLFWSPPTVADAIEASIQGYMTKAEAEQVAHKDGLDTQYFDALYNTAGSPLSKTEMLRLYRMGKVTRAEVVKALQQSRLKDSYIDHAIELSVTLPALYEVRALLANGSLSPAQGTKILLEDGYQEDIIKAIVTSAANGTVATHKAITETMIVELYQEQAISSAELITELKALGYKQPQAEMIKAIYDNKIAIANRDAVITKIRSAYTGYKIDERQAQNELNELHVPVNMVDKLIADWNLIREADIKLLTPAQVADVWFMDLFNPGSKPDNLAQALEYLNHLGYSGDDAIHILEIKNKGPLGG